MKRPRVPAPSAAAVAIALIALAILAAFGASIYRPSVQFSYTSQHPTALSFRGVSDYSLLLWRVRYASFEARSVDLRSALAVYGLPPTTMPIWAGFGSSADGLDTITIHTEDSSVSVCEDGSLAGDATVLASLYHTDQTDARVSFSCADPIRLHAILLGHLSLANQPLTGFDMIVTHPSPYAASITLDYSEDQALPQAINLSLRDLAVDSDALGFLHASTEGFLLYLYDPTFGDCSFQMNSPSGSLDLSYGHVLVAYNGHPATITAAITGQGIIARSYTVREPAASPASLSADLQTHVSEVSTMLQPAHLVVGTRHLELQQLDSLRVASIEPIEPDAPLLPPVDTLEAYTWASYTSGRLLLQCRPPATTQFYFGGNASDLRLNGEPLTTTLWEDIPEFVRVTFLAVLAALFTTLVKDAITERRPSRRRSNPGATSHPASLYTPQAGQRDMPAQLAWSYTVTGKPFAYEGDLTAGLVVYPTGDDRTELSGKTLRIPAEGILFIRREIESARSIAMGACRDNPAHGSLGDKLRQRGSSPQWLSYVVPLLREDGFCDAFKQGRGYVVRYAGP
jgi:hypothetical protein